MVINDRHIRTQGHSEDINATDLRSQEHESGQVQQTLELAPGGLPAGGQQGDRWPAGEHHAQALAHQQLQVRRHLGHAEHPVLQAAHVTGSLIWAHGERVQNEHPPLPANGTYIWPIWQVSISGLHIKCMASRLVMNRYGEKRSEEEHKSLLSRTRGLQFRAHLLSQQLDTHGDVAHPVQLPALQAPPVDQNLHYSGQEVL